MSWTKPTFQTFDMRVITMRSLFLSFWFLGKSKEFSVPRFRGLLEELGLFVNVIGIVPGGVPIDCFIVPASPAYQCNSFRASYVVLRQMAPKAKQLLALKAARYV
ncbi:orf104a (mitochondrion) [Beta vulgaris subsp. vulgaris]|uniref:Orf104a protein n=3 Tax=Beta TaxID=3554 RepID=Q9MFD0_BETVV|nr:orf104a [Beta vulgaris subsp. vulgaris]YP_004222373.1 hypothetical protein LKY74_mgp025 [Beta vulgaris subsp. maritima]YP_004842179.1 hypothetical protein LKY79_mgp026 [Beta macrocarpa]CBJ14012.1 hypothetical protein [Beta vulgaris subsp. maritima]CBJ17588.1 hypothetical protein [Beta vulgaris subsp. maritima]CBJ20706.1 hypothetical protein [Beta vulgaris subsp. maritima]CBL54133.1 hypothetical protein [Beta vulgaris subsp. maritima]CBX24984.1 hypothetical protein [Beta macrocarpa]